MIYHNGSNDLNGLDEDVAKVSLSLAKHLDRFDSIAVQGLSGITVGLLASRQLGKPLCIVRKPGEGSHSGIKGVVNRLHMGTRVLFLDDFIAMGETRDRVEEAVVRNGGQVVGTLQYCHIEFPTDYDAGDDGLYWSDNES